MIIDNKNIDKIEDEVTTVLVYVWLIIIYSLLILGTYKICKMLYNYLILFNRH